MEDEYLKLLKLSCKFLKFGGMDVEGNIIVSHIYALFVSVLTVFLLILAVIELILNYKGLDTFANIVETVCLNWAFFFRIAVYVFNFRKIQALMARVHNDLWPIDKFGDVIRDTIQGIIDTEVKCIKIIVSFVFISLVVTYGKPLFVYPRALPLACYLIIDISDTTSYYLMYLWQIFLMYFQILLLLGWNAMFLSFCTYLVTQFSMLKHAFRSLSSKSISSVEDEANCYENLKEYVDYHNKLLQFATEMKNIYYVQLFLQVVTMTVSICIQLYFVNVVGFSHIPSVTKAIGFTADYLTELFLICFAGSAFTKACDVTDAVYDNGWERKSKRFKIATRMIILQSQVPQVLTGGGIFEINLNGYTSAVSMAFSVYTLLMSFREEHY